MPGDTKVLFTDEFQKDVTKIKDNLIRSRIKKLVQQLIDNPKETAIEGQPLRVKPSKIIRKQLRSSKKKLILSNLLGQLSY